MPFLLAFVVHIVSAFSDCLQSGILRKFNLLGFFYILKYIIQRASSTGPLMIEPSTFTTFEMAA
jgi:hypothetical protein